METNPDITLMELKKVEEVRKLSHYIGTTNNHRKGVYREGIELRHIKCITYMPEVTDGIMEIEESHHLLEDNNIRVVAEWIHPVCNGFMKKPTVVESQVVEAGTDKWKELIEEAHKYLMRMAAEVALKRKKQQEKEEKNRALQEYCENVVKDVLCDDK